MTETGKSRSATVGDVQAGMIISMPDTDLPEAVVQAISEVTLGNMRQILLIDPKTGESLPTRLILPVTREVVIHEVFVRRQSYTNISSAPVVVSLSKPPMTVGPGEVFEYTGLARPDAFPAETWTHRSKEVEIGHETWSTI